MKTNLQKKMDDLFRAIKSNKSAKVRKVLLKNPELVNHHECLDKTGASPLWKAMLKGHNKIVELIIRDFGADPDEKCRIKNEYFSGWTFLMYAVTFNDEFRILQVTETLLKHGAVVNVELHNETLLEVAVAKGYLKFVELLLKNGAKLPLESDGHHSLVGHIFRQPENRKDLLLLLIEYGLDTGYVDDKYKQNQLHIFIGEHVVATDEDAVDIAKILIEQLCNGISIDGTDKNNRSPLIYAVDVPHLPLISFFIKKGADVNRIINDENGKTSLHSAVSFENLDLVKLLLKNGADINAKCFDGSTVMHEACKNTNEELIKLLIREGADISVEDDRVLTPFFLLNTSSDSYDDCARRMIREFSKLKFDKISISKMDMDLLQENLEVRDYFQKSLSELERMKNYKFHAPFSYYSVLKMTKNIKKLAYLTKNKEFLANFEANLNSLSCYEDDLREILEEAIHVKKIMEIVESRLKYIFGDFLPQTVIRKLSDNLTLEDLPID